MERFSPRTLEGGTSRVPEAVEMGGAWPVAQGTYLVAESRFTPLWFRVFKTSAPRR